MANLIATADGNWTTNTTWANAEAGASAAQLTRSASTSVTGTGYTWSAAFTCTNTDVMDGVLLHLKRNGTTGTITVGLSADNGTSAAREVTVNASDLPADPAWVFFKFSSTLTADGGSDYKVGVKCSSGGSGATVYRDGTAGNWTRLVRTTANPAGAPAAGDNLFIAKEWTAAATGTARAVTMDNTGTTDHGPLDVGQGGTLSFGTSASTAYLLKISGDVNVWSGGTLNMGATGAGIPSTSSAALNLDCASNVQYGLIINSGGAWNALGASLTKTWTLLAANAAANATSLTTTDSTGWKDNDTVIVASTTRTYNQSEIGALNGDAVGTALAVDGFGGAGGGLANAHGGSSPVQAEIVNCTRNVKVYGASAAYQGYVYIADTASVDLDWVEMYWLGSNTANKRGLNLATTTGSFNAHGCAMHTWSVAGSCLVISGAAASNITIDNCVVGNLNGNFLVIANATSGTWTISNSVFVYCYQASAVGWNLADVGGNVSAVRIAGATSGGIYCNEEAALGTWSDIVIHSCGGSQGGLRFVLKSWGTVSNLTIWRNNYYGLFFDDHTRKPFVFDGLTLFGNLTNNIALAGAAGRHNVALTFKNGTLAGDSTFSTTYGVRVDQAGCVAEARFETCTFGVASGIFVAHATSDFSVGANILARFTLNNCVALVPANLADVEPGSYLSYQRYGQTDADHRTYYQQGTLQTDAVIYKTAAPSERATPLSASIKLLSGAHRKAVDDGATATFSVWVRKSVLGDGAAYNGNQPRLILRANPAAGIAADVVLDTAAAAAGDWEQLTGTSAAVTDDAVLEAYVDLDGTAGWVNADDWS